MEYFASVDEVRLISTLHSKINDYYEHLLTTGRLADMRRGYNTYYGKRGAHNSSFISAAGDQGELSLLMSNEFRNLVQHILVLATQSRTALETVAINTDSTSKAQSYLSKGIIEYFRRDGNIDSNIYQAAECALIMGSGWVFNEFDPNRGENITVDPDTQTPIGQGDIYSRFRTPLEVVQDLTRHDVRMLDWIIVKDPINKFDLAALYPEKAIKIKSMSRDTAQDALYMFGDHFDWERQQDSDDLDVWTFFHKKTPAMPQGRMFRFVCNEALYDGPIPYRKLPGNRIAPCEQILSGMGYSNAKDLLSLQDVLDSLVSAGVTNMTSTGVNNIWCKPGQNWDFKVLAQGMNLVEMDEKPETLVLNRLAPEWLSMVNFIIQRMEAYSGLNSIARGNLEGKDFSGAAMALLQSMAIQFNSGFQRAINKLTEDCGNDIIMLTQDFGTEPTLGLIVGEGNKYMMKKYSGKDIQQIKRVYCRQSNPMKDTTAGRLAIVQEAMQLKGGITAEQFSELIDTGNTDCLLEAGRNLRLAMDQENEALVNGEIPPVIFTDNHPEHIKKHQEIFAAPEDRRDVGLLERVKAHIDAHINEWLNTDPNVLAALGIPPVIMPPPMMGPQGPGLPPGPGGPPQPNPSNPPIAQEMAPPGAPAEVNMPNMPKNPMSGESWNPQTGGMPQ